MTFTFMLALSLFTAPLNSHPWSFLVVHIPCKCLPNAELFHDCFFQNRNINHILGMYITKQAELDTHTQLPMLPVSALLISEFFGFFLAFSGFIDRITEECDRKQGKRGE